MTQVGPGVNSDLFCSSQKDAKEGSPNGSHGQQIPIARAETGRDFKETKGSAVMWKYIYCTCIFPPLRKISKEVFGDLSKEVSISRKVLTLASYQKKLEQCSPCLHGLTTSCQMSALFTSLNTGQG